ncbi:MAG: 50S ribosomal protein L6 [Candidatus Pacebacteria bacterium]|jgi:large subunit ribosomal protein L6|nr:50S ribosomal protein L6 [Candidatus Paceibacterota bacterium]MBT3511518.1 50S ribosomal protein L6 [Candidatus Paceibacterota bacterium]MBT4005012.1 50S ribosomal protein L6 [Candidatus Paceibacterota bacterium]MBT4358788.1 50S ribosomal protein L6 [Candidatus Paceibacterota bacterium]MBT4680596.1 50S ribosomal protein L6 [Candidatus Paceibacterota bacterium]
MSKIGRMLINIPAGVTVEIGKDAVVVKGPKGELSTKILSGIKVEQKDNTLEVLTTNHEKQTNANHGLIRSLINNNVIGVTEGYKKTLKMVGTGYRVQQRGTGLNLQVGFSHDVEFSAPAGITLALEGNDTIIVSGIDKQQVGQTAAEIRLVKKPEPYKGKGIRYEDEVVKRKQGKASIA